MPTINSLPQHPLQSGLTFMARSPPATEQQLSIPTIQPSSGAAHLSESESENVGLGYSFISGSNALVDLQEVDTCKR
jgi:hypothetical protein